MEVLLKNLVQNTELFLSQENTDIVLETIDWGSVQSLTNSIQYINLIGSEIQSTLLQPRSIAIVAWLVSDNETDMTSKKKAVNSFINPLQDIECQYKKYSIVFRPDTSVQYNNTEIRYNNQVLCRFLIQGTAYMPLFGLIQKEEKRKGTNSLPMFPLIIPKTKGRPFGVIPEENFAKATNRGDVDVGFTMEMQASLGKVSNPKIIDNKTGEFIEVVVDLDLGDSLIVSTVSGNKYVTLIRNGSEIDMLKAVTKQSTMSLMLHVGSNDFTVTAASNPTNLESVLTFSPLWVEIQEAEVY